MRIRGVCVCSLMDREIKYQGRGKNDGHWWYNDYKTLACQENRRERKSRCKECRRRRRAEDQRLCVEKILFSFCTSIHVLLLIISCLSQWSLLPSLTWYTVAPAAVLVAGFADEDDFVVGSDHKIREKPVKSGKCIRWLSFGGTERNETGEWERNFILSVRLYIYILSRSSSSPNSHSQRSLFDLRQWTLRRVSVPSFPRARIRPLFCWHVFPFSFWPNSTFQSTAYPRISLAVPLSMNMK